MASLSVGNRKTQGDDAMMRLGLALAAYQQKHDLENRQMAKEIGIPASTLSRVKNGTMPDAFGMVKIIAWLVSPHGEAR